VSLQATPFGLFLEAPPPPVDWLVPGLIPAGVPGVFASQPNAGKSFLALQLCVSVATGTGYLGFGIGSKPRGAMFLSLEDPEEAVHRRFRAVADALRAAGTWSDEIESHLRNAVLLTPAWGQGEEPATTYLPHLMPALEEGIAKFAEREIPPGILIIDTLNQASGGDENSAKDSRPVITACFELAGRHGWTPLLLHHVAKNQTGARSNEKRSLDDRMSPDWLRGSSAIHGAARYILQLAALLPAEAEKLGLDGEKARRGGYQIFGNTKQSMGPRGAWTLLEQIDSGEPGAGTWTQHPHAVDLLAQMKGGRAVEELSRLDLLLVELYRTARAKAEPDRKALAEQMYAGAKDPAHSLRSGLARLRTMGFVQRQSLLVTPAGWDRGRELSQRDASGDA